jgi:predicted O-methyltransferase YrrM
MAQPPIFLNDWFSANISRFDRHLAELRGAPCAILEIGCHEGRATTWLLQNVATHPDSRITALDIELQPNCHDNVAASGGTARVKFIQGKSRDVLRNLPVDHYDFIYVDGSHATVDVIEDAVLAFRLARVGALIAFDDYLWDDPKYNQHGTPRLAIDAFLLLYGTKTRLLERHWQVWVRKLSD